ncbi:probable arginine--tRNA ligase, mitochondrial [Limulus polyphemus]|uniref:Probable arginine--tRNA ligase, mitochondrial n=1 Tax=Limulus polyphemus TaxID=6850 RepID=A0ABM1BZ92_LIMPO|nr:probable arginine--tRNA ligase, mitochondrial [Limulus polyphemus]
MWLAWKSLKDFDSMFLNLSSCDFLSLIKKELSKNTTGEITDVNQLNDQQQHLVFVVDNKSFVKDTLQLSSRNMEKLSEISTLLSYIPHQKVVVEYSSPNIAKAFHVGHLRSTIIGGFIANLHEFIGHDVTRLNYLGDWGTQCGLLLAGYQQFGSEDDLHQNPLYHLLRVYVMANKEAEKNSSFLDHAKHLFFQMENGEKTILTHWKKFRDLSIEEYNKVYKRLGVKFDKYESESMYSKAAKYVLERMEENGHLSTDKNNPKVLKLKLANGQEQNVTVAKSDGSTLYLSRQVYSCISTHH